MSKILAIDLGKNNSAICMFDRDSLKSEFRTIHTRKQVMHDLFVEFADQIEVVLFETGSQMGWVADILWALGIPFKVANTNHTAWKWKNNPNKSDRKDAHRLAVMYNAGFFPTVHLAVDTVEVANFVGIQVQPDRNPPTSPGEDRVGKLELVELSRMVAVFGAGGVVGPGGGRRNQGRRHEGRSV